MPVKQLLSPLQNHLAGLSAKGGQDSSLKTGTWRREAPALPWKPLTHPGLSSAIHQFILRSLPRSSSNSIFTGHRTRPDQRARMRSPKSLPLLLKAFIFSLTAPLPLQNTERRSISFESSADYISVRELPYCAHFFHTYFRHV